MTIREIVWIVAISLLGLGLLRVAAIAERLEPKVVQAIDDFHAVREQLPEFKKIGTDGVKAVRDFSIFRQQDEHRGRR